MFLNETPHIKLRKANGLINIDYTACDIIGLSDDDSRPAAARSYSTIIGVYTRTSDDTKIYLETSGVYSTTTAAKHKPRAAAIAAYNNFKIIEGINPDVLHNLYFYPSTAPAVEEIIKESEERKQILQALYNNDYNNAVILHAKYSGRISAAREPQSKQYKNGNYQTKYYYKTNFKYIANIQYELNVKAIKYTVQTRTGPAVTNKYNSKIVNIREW